MATGNKPVNCHDSEIIDEDALLEVASSSKKGNVPDQISLPMKDFTDMKEQNLRILALLGDLFDGNEKIPKSGKRAKRPRVVEKSSDESEVNSLLGKDQSDVIHSPPPPPPPLPRAKENALITRMVIMWIEMQISMLTRLWIC